MGVQYTDMRMLIKMSSTKAIADRVVTQAHTTKPETHMRMILHMAAILTRKVNMIDKVMVRTPRIRIKNSKSLKVVSDMKTRNERSRYIRPKPHLERVTNH